MKFTTILLCAVFCFVALFAGSAQADLSPYPEDCSKFRNCDRYECWIMSCGPGTEFFPAKGACDYPVNPHPWCKRH